MKNFVVVKFERFVDLAEEFHTSMKFFSVESVAPKRVLVSAWCFVQTFYLSWEQEIDVSELQSIQKRLESNDFTEGKLVDDKNIALVQ